MRIVVTPMCEKIVLWAGICNYTVNKYPDTVEDADIAIVLSKRKTEMNSINIELNTFQEIKDGIKIVSRELSDGSVSDERINKIFKYYVEANDIINNLEDIRLKNSEINVKVYSVFLNDVVKDLGFNILNDEKDCDYIIYPDFMEDKVKSENYDCELIMVPSHSNVSNDPIKRAIFRYSTILNSVK